MTQQELPSESDGRVNRRTVLKSAVAAGFAGSAFVGTASADGWHELEFCAANDEDYFSYEVHVSKEIRRGSNTDGGDEVSGGGKVAMGASGKGRCDGWRFKGEIKDLRLNGRGKVYVNGSVVKDTTGSGGGKSDGGKSGKSGKKKELRFQSVDNRLFSYRVEVSGSIERAPNRDGGDTKINENTAEGRARGGNHDDWFMTGHITKLHLDGPGKVLVDGEVVRDTTKDDTGETRTVIVSSPNTDQLMEYSFTVDGEVRELEPNEDSGPATETIIDLGGGRTRVEGAVSYGDDRFEITGPIVSRSLPSAVVLEEQ